MRAASPPGSARENAVRDKVALVTAASLRTFKTKLLDQRAPFHMLGRDVAPHLVDRRRVVRDQADGRDSFPHLRVGHDPLHFGMQPVDDRPRCLGRHQQHVPGHAFVIRRAGCL